MPVRKFAFALAFIFIISAIAASRAKMIMTPQGVGPVKIGMKVAETERAHGAKFNPITLPFSEECWITKRAGGKDPNILYMIEGDTMVRIDIYIHGSDALAVETAEGAGLKSAGEDLKRCITVDEYAETRLAFVQS